VFSTSLWQIYMDLTSPLDNSVTVEGTMTPPWTTRLKYPLGQLFHTPWTGRSTWTIIIPWLLKHKWPLLVLPTPNGWTKIILLSTTFEKKTWYWKETNPLFQNNTPLGQCYLKYDPLGHVFKIPPLGQKNTSSIGGVRIISGIAHLHGSSFTCIYTGQL
jgi:hypothetical protein